MKMNYGVTFAGLECRRNNGGVVRNHSIMFTGHTDLDVGLARDYLRFLKIELIWIDHPYGTEVQVQVQVQVTRYEKRIPSGRLEVKEEDIY